MKTISKKITIYIFVGFLVFCTTSTTYYRTAHAMEWVGGALAFEEALKWTLAVLGITATAGMTDAYWDEYGDEFVDYAIENGATQQEVTQWQMKLCEGILDKGSDIWTSFKNWASTLVSSGSGSGSGSGVLSYPCSLSSLHSYVVGVLGYQNSTISSNADNIMCYGFYCDSLNADGCFINYITTEDPSFSIVNNTVTNVSGKSLTYINCTVRPNSAVNIGGAFPWYNNNSKSFGVSSFSNLACILGGVSITGSSDKIISIELGDGVVDDPTNDDFVSVPDIDIPNIDVISADIPDEDDPEITLPFPGLDTSDDSISSDTYDDIIGAINDGTISIDDGIDDIISRLRVISYDEVTGDIIPPRPDPDDPTKNVKKDDVVNDNKNNMGFTLAGLEGVFPFCIPWDIYAFMTLLVADPVAPEFDFPIKSVNNQTEEIHVDLAPFEPVAVVVRYIFDFLFIIGLAMLTRSLIGGGSSD